MRSPSRLTRSAHQTLDLRELAIVSAGGPGPPHPWYVPVNVSWVLTQAVLVNPPVVVSIPVVIGH